MHFFLHPRRYCRGLGCAGIDVEPPRPAPLLPLVPLQDQPSSYKTKACRSFVRTGRCPYGPRCRFMHEGWQGDVSEALLQRMVGEIAAEIESIDARR